MLCYNQNKAKKSVAVAVYNHYKRIKANKNNENVDLQKVILRGSTGSGKH